MNTYVIRHGFGHARQLYSFIFCCHLWNDKKKIIYISVTLNIYDSIYKILFQTSNSIWLIVWITFLFLRHTILIFFLNNHSDLFFIFVKRMFVFIMTLLYHNFTNVNENSCFINISYILLYCFYAPHLIIQAKHIVILSNLFHVF